MPELLQEGRVYRYETPLYVVKTKNKTHYFYTDEEYENSSVKGEMSYIKGLGELNPDDFRNTLFSNEQRKKQITWSLEDQEELEKLMGEEGSYRKSFLMENADFSKVNE